MLVRVTLFCVFSALALASCAAVQDEVAPEQVPLVDSRVSGRHAVTWLSLSDAGPAAGQTRAPFDAAGAARVSVSFLAQGRGAYAVRAVCSGRARPRPADEGISPAAWTAPGQSVALRIEPGERGQTRLELHPETRDCDLQVTPGGRPAWSLHLTRADEALPRLAALDAPVAPCAAPAAPRDPLLAAFHASGALAATCPMPAGPVTWLPDGIDALNARIAALTGRPLWRGWRGNGAAPTPPWLRTPRRSLI